MTRRLGPLAALAMVALVGAGCSSTGSSGDSGNTAHHEKAVKFAECMRDNGVSGFPDPDASGELTIDGVVNGSSLDPNSPAWKKAISACKDLQPPGFTGHKRSAEEQAAALKFAQCIRDNGVKDFPDPAKGEPLVDTRRIPSTARPGGMSILNAAMQKCRDVAASAGVRRAGEAEDLGAGRSGRPGCRSRHRRRGRHVQRQRKRPRPHRSRRRTP